jgi:hypothetical protein
VNINPLAMAEVPEAETRTAEPEVTPAPGAMSTPKPEVIPVPETLTNVPVKEAVLLVKLERVPAVDAPALTLSNPPVPVYAPEWVTWTRPLAMAEVPEAVTCRADPEVTPAPGETTMSLPVVVPVKEAVIPVPVKEAVLLVKLTRVPAVEVVARTLRSPPVPV